MAGKGNKLFRQHEFIVAKYQFRSFKSFHRLPLYRPSTVRTDIVTRVQNARYMRSLVLMPLVSKVPCNILRFYVEICTTLTAAARAVPDLSSPFPLIFFSGRSIGQSVSSHLYPPLCVVVAKWPWISLYVIA